MSTIDYGTLARTKWKVGAAVSVLLVLGLMAFAMPNSASAADRTVQLTLDAPGSACTTFDTMDCAYLEARNGNEPAPDTSVDPPTGAMPTFLNLALLPSPAVINGVIGDDDSFTANQGNVHFPTYPTTLENPLVGTVDVAININQTGDWTGTFNQGTGDVDINAPLGLTFKLNCDPAANGTCGLIFGAEGNMGTWKVDTLADPQLISGNSPSTAPPADYLAGPPVVTDWEPALVTDGAPYTAGPPESVTLINNTLRVEHLEPSNCIDPSSVACSNAIVGGLIAPALNDAIGTQWAAGLPETFKDSVKGAIDMNLPFTLADQPIITSSPGSLDFGDQPQATSGVAQTVAVTASSAGDLSIKNLYKTGAERSDFWISNNDCGTTIAAGQSCALDLRFNPSASGARNATLMIKVINPVNGKSESYQLATLTGNGGDLPTGPTGATGATGDQGPKGDRGPQGPKGKKGDRGPAAPVVKQRTGTKVRGTTAIVARIKCKSDNCKVTRRSAKAWVNHRRVGAKVKVANRIKARHSTKVRVKLNRKAARRLKRAHRRGSTFVKLVVKTTHGAQTNATMKVKLKK